MTTREPIEDCETAALRAARLAYTRASRSVDECLAALKATTRRSEADPGNRQLKSERAVAHERYAAAIQRMPPLRSRYHEAEAADRGRGNGDD